MANAKDYYLQDFNDIMRCNLGEKIQFKNHANGAIDFEVEYFVGRDRYTDSVFPVVFIPECKNHIVITKHILTQDAINCILQPQLSVITTMGMPYGRIAGCEIVDTARKIIIYTDNIVSSAELAELDIICKKLPTKVNILDKSSFQQRNELSHPLAFISYDYRDRQFAEKLVLELSRKLCPVWFDEYQIKPGDVIRSKIEDGIRKCKKCIILGSNHYFTNTSYAKHEFETAFVQHKGNGNIIPILLPDNDIDDNYPSIFSYTKYLTYDITKLENIASTIHNLVK